MKFLHSALLISHMTNDKMHVCMSIIIMCNMLPCHNPYSYLVPTDHGNFMSHLRTTTINIVMIINTLKHNIKIRKTLLLVQSFRWEIKVSEAKVLVGSNRNQVLV